MNPFAILIADKFKTDARKRISFTCEILLEFYYNSFMWCFIVLSFSILFLFVVLLQVASLINELLRVIFIVFIL